MERIPYLETNRFSANQEIPRILWDSKVYYRVCKCPPSVPIYLAVVTNENDFWFMIFCAMTICRNVSEEHDRDSGFLRKAGSDYTAS